jgi:hypothetical protein
VSFRFDQDEDHLLYAGGAPTGDFTVEMWVQFNSVTSTFISFFWMGTDDAYSGTVYQRAILLVTGSDPDTLEVWARDATAARIVSPNGSLITTRPMHIALTGNTGDNQPLELFFDGVSVGSSTTGVQGTYEAAQVMLGNDRQLDVQDPDTNFSTGSLAYCVVSNRIKTVEEIRAGMFDFLTAAQSSWGAWPLLDTNGLLDHSGNGRDMTQQGTPVVDNVAFPAAYDGFYPMGGWLRRVAAGGTTYTQTLSSNVLLNDETLPYAFRNRRLEDFLSIADDFVASVIANVIFTNVLTSNVAVSDQSLAYAFRNRVMDDAVTVTEGTTVISTIYNMLATDEVTIVDELLRWARFNRIIQDDIVITDGVITNIIGYLIFTSVLTSNVAVTDETIPYRLFNRLLDSNVLTTDQALSALRVTRDLIDAIDVFDEHFSALQRFILLTDALSVDDSFASLVLTPTTATPAIRIGFDQPRIELGGYAI